MPGSSHAGSTSPATGSYLIATMVDGVMNELGESRLDGCFDSALSRHITGRCFNAVQSTVRRLVANSVFLPCRDSPLCRSNLVTKPVHPV